MSEYNAENGPWGKAGDVELASSEDKLNPPLRQAQAQDMPKANKGLSPLAWIGSSFTFRGILGRKEYLQLILMPALTLLMCNLWLQQKLQPLFLESGMGFSQEMLLKTRLYMEGLPSGQFALIFIVSLSVFFCLWSMIVSSTKRLKDCGLSPLASFMISIIAILALWPIAIIIFSFIPSKQNKN